MCQRFDKEGKITITLVEVKNFGIPKFFVAKFCMGLKGLILVDRMTGTLTYPLTWFL